MLTIGQDIISGNMGYIGTEPGRLYRMGPQSKVAEASGEPPMVLADCKKKPLKGLRIYGKSKQVTTTGAQLLDISKWTTYDTTYGLTMSIQDDIVRLKGIFQKDEVGKRTNAMFRFIKTSPGTVFPENVKFTAEIVNNTGTDGIYFTLTGLKENAPCIVISFFATCGDEVDIQLRPMLYVGDPVPKYEMYTGGQSSPSPDYPQEIESVVNPTVKVTNEDELKAQSVTFNNITLNAIPVSSGGNVTINGQQYIADYVDVERGKLVKKLKSFTRTDIKVLYTWGVNENADNITGFFFYTKDSDLPEADNAVMMSTILRYSNNAWGGSEVGCAMNIKNNYAMLSVPTYALEDSSSDENACASFMKICENTNAIFFYSMASPIETDLTSDQLAAYKQLHTYKGTTIIDNDAGAYMSVKYNT